jgi:dTDP-glucose 4,6-dehydratase
MRLLVTGGAGFIGSNYIYHVLQNHPGDMVVNLDKLTYAGNLQNLTEAERQWGGERYHFVQGDIGDRLLVERLLREHEIEAIVNFAAESHVDRSIHDSSPFLDTNVLGTHALLEAARALELPRFVHISTDEVYGTLGDEGLFTEETPLAPNSPYSASKASSDLLCRAFHETYGQPVIVTRCSNNYGPYQFPEKLIPLIFMKAMNDEPLPIYGTGMNVRDWIYVEDHCRGVDLALRKGRPGAIYNFGGDSERTNLEVVRAILRELGKDESLITFVKDRPGHDLRYAMDFSLAERELGFAPAETFDTGLAKTLQWYMDHGEWLANVQSGAYLEFMDHWYKERR